jgi:hypothetical protein
LRNPHDEDFLLSWWLQEGECSALHSVGDAEAPAGSDSEAPLADANEDVDHIENDADVAKYSAAAAKTS